MCFVRFLAAKSSLNEHTGSTIKATAALRYGKVTPKEDMLSIWVST